MNRNDRPLEDLLAEINARFFIREFTFAKNQFRPAPGVQVEFADHVVWIKNLLFLFQLKQREAIDAPTAETERSWFERKVLKKATKQIRDTISYLKHASRIEITNQVGHSFDVRAALSKPINIVLHLSQKELPDDCWQKKCHVSRDVGFIHVFPAHDYLGVCLNLVTPAEIAEYLQHRQDVLTRWPECEQMSEKTILGHFVGGNPAEKPVLDDAEFLEGLSAEVSRFSLNDMLDGIRERIYHATHNGAPANPTNYYRILEEMLLLNRSELEQVKVRIKRSVQASGNNESVMPFRMAFPQSGCGFLFVPLRKSEIEGRWKFLNNMTQLAKYDLKVDRIIGVSFAKEGTHFLMDWAFTESIWKPNVEMDAMLKELNPFRPMKGVINNRYG